MASKAKPAREPIERVEDKLLKQLSAGLSKEEIQRVLAGALSSLGRKGIDCLADKLGPETGGALRRAMDSRGRKSPPVPGPAKVLQECRLCRARHRRHTFASHLVMQGADLYTVAKLLGHANIKTTEIYAHLAPDYLRSAVTKLRFTR